VLSIGALSHATGVPVETLRTWERRYGFPAPIDRIDSGHRRYPLDAVERLRLAVQALELGHKPSVALRASVDTLRELLAVTTEPRGDRPSSPALPPAGRTFIERCVEYIRRLDGEALVRELEHAWNEAGTMEFLLVYIGPLLRAIGDGWSDGKLEIGHEHFASEHIREFLSGKWRPMSERARGPRVVCATVAGELHVLGLHMAATALALAGARVIFLGANTPPEEVARAAVAHEAAGVALSAATGVNRRVLEQDVRAVRSLLPDGTPIAVGGSGFEPAPPGVEPKHDLRALAEWTTELAR
jgi:MerR family transcriptional regulator, light-induced transcriptional regulator